MWVEFTHVKLYTRYNNIIVQTSRSVCTFSARCRLSGDVEAERRCTVFETRVLGVFVDEQRNVCYRSYSATGETSMQPGWVSRAPARPCKCCEPGTSPHRDRILLRKRIYCDRYLSVWCGSQHNSNMLGEADLRQARLAIIICITRMILVLYNMKTPSLPITTIEREFVSRIFRFVDLVESSCLIPMVVEANYSSPHMSNGFHKPRSMWTP